MKEALKLALEALERSVATCFVPYAHRQVMSQPDHFINKAIRQAKEALREHDMREVQRLGQEIKQEPVVGIVAITTWLKDGRHVTRTPCDSWVDTTPPQRTEQEPVVLRFNEWAVRKNDLSDYICVGELTLAGIEDNLGGPEFGEPEIERFDDVIDALQEKLVIGRECKKVPLIAYIGANDTTPPQEQQSCDKRQWVGLTDEEIEKVWDSGVRAFPLLVRELEAKLKEKNT